MRKLVLDNDILFERVVELLGRGKEVTIPVKGTSMLPFIRGEKDLVVLRGTLGARMQVEESGAMDMEDCEQVGAGDIVLFRYGGRYIMHRILSVRDGVAEIMGDGVVKNRERCPVGDIYGKAVTILRGGKRAVSPDSGMQRILSRIWLGIMPLRRYILAVYRRLPWT